MSVRLLLCLIAFLPPGAVLAQQEAAVEHGLRATEIVDGDTLVLSDGRQVRLVGIQAPKLPLGRPNFPTWPLAEEAKAVLGALALGRDLRLVYTGRPMDRHGRQLAHVYARTNEGETADDEIWVQGALLERGLARVYSFPDNRALVDDLLAREIAARAAGRGIWADRFYAIRGPGEAARHIGTFQLVEGRVLGAAVVRGRAYLNFGADWKTDFTVTLEPAVRRLFEAEGIDPRHYEDRRLRIRGWLKSFNGPMIEVTHPEQIEVLTP